MLLLPSDRRRRRHGRSSKSVVGLRGELHRLEAAYAAAREDSRRTAEGLAETVRDELPADTEALAGGSPAREPAPAWDDLSAPEFGAGPTGPQARSAHVAAVARRREQAFALAVESCRAQLAAAQSTHRAPADPSTPRAARTPPR